MRHRREERPSPVLDGLFCFLQLFILLVVLGEGVNVGALGEELVFDKTIAAYLLLLADEILTVFSFGTGTTSVNDGLSRVKVGTVACKPLDFEAEVDFGRVGKQGIRVERAVESLAGLLEVQEIAIVEMGC